MNVITLQRVLNAWGIRDSQGRKLVEDGLRGANTNYAISVAKSMLRVIMS